MQWLDQVDDTKILNRKYWDRYVRLISSAKPNSGYKEMHHAWPRSLGGRDTQDNMFPMTARQHYVAHMLLARALGGNMWFAVWAMSNLRDGGRSTISPTSRSYERARREYISRMSVLSQKQDPVKKSNESWSKRPEVWKNAQALHDIWTKYNKPGAIRLAKLVGYKSGDVLETMIDRFRGRLGFSAYGPWIPKEDQLWLDFFSGMSPDVELLEEVNEELIEMLLTGKRHDRSTRLKMSIASSKKK